jgi:hypothetical protein
MSGALFVADGELLLPQPAARGPWNPKALHGAAVAALLGGAFDLEGWTVTRVSVDLLGAVPFAPMRLMVTPPAGGRRVMRQTATLLVDDRPVAVADCVCVRQVELDFEASPLAHDSPFADMPTPDLSTVRPGVAERVGWECFDSLGVAVAMLKPVAEGTLGYWIRLVAPVVEGRPTNGLQRVLAAADHSSGSTNLHLPFKRWSFMNADLSVHLSRPLSGEWVGVMSSSIAQPVGAGLGLGALFDADGRLGTAEQSLLLESRALT